jgi:hypothetical protein
MPWLATNPCTSTSSERVRDPHREQSLTGLASNAHLRCYLIPCWNALARERGVSGRVFVTGRLRSRASALLQWIFATHAIVVVHPAQPGIFATHSIAGALAVRRSRLAGERGVSGKTFVTGRLLSRASALLQWIFATHAIVVAHPPQPGIFATHSIAGALAVRRSRLAGERGVSGKTIVTGKLLSRASALLQWIFATHAIVVVHQAQPGIFATHAIVVVHPIVGAGLLADAVCQARHLPQANCDRGQTRYYSEPRQHTKSPVFAAVLFLSSRVS